MLENFQFTELSPLRDEVLDVLSAMPKLLERKPIAERITAKMPNFRDVNQWDWSEVLG